MCVFFMFLNVLFIGTNLHSGDLTVKFQDGTIGKYAIRDLRLFTFIRKMIDEIGLKNSDEAISLLVSQKRFEILLDLTRHLKSQKRS